MIRVTRKDVARYAGVSETVVSYVLNDNRYVDKEKRRRVLEAVKQLGYSPSPAARALKGKASRHLLFIADDLVSEYFGSILSSMMEMTKGEGYLISLCSDTGDEDFISRVNCWDFDGIIIASSTISNADIMHFISSGMPVVLFAMKDYPAFEGDYGMIYTGLKEGSEDAVRLFQGRGRRRIAYADGKNIAGRHVDPDDFRYKGYLSAIGDAEPITIDGCRTDNEVGEKITAAYFKHHFDALLCRTDAVAAEALDALKSAGVDIPGDVAVMGFNNTRMARHTSPPLSTVAMKRVEIASSALSLIKQLQKGEGGCVSVRLETELVLRDST